MNTGALTVASRSYIRSPGRYSGSAGLLKKRSGIVFAEEHQRLHTPYQASVGQEVEVHWRAVHDVAVDDEPSRTVLVHRS